MMDVSGSMTDTKKRLVRLVTFWIDTWLKANYRNLATRYIVHDYEAGEVDENTFYHIRENGGTRISSAYTMAQKIIQKDYNPADWNIYAFHFSDGENSGNEDDQRCLKMLSETLLPTVNLFCFGQIQSEEDYLFRGFLEKNLNDDKMVTAQITDDRDIYSAIKAFLGKGY
jgi:uncharacterized sporulation protein YeaH/YhbH (DUF444 family)